jgi:iron complex outermembrane recepter protein
MKKLILLPFVFFSLMSVAQMPGGGSGNMASMMKNMKNMNIGRIYGKILDAKTKKPVEYASVVLLWFNKDSLIGGCLAKENGDFALENLPSYGGFRLKVSFIGYKTYETKVYITPPNKIDQDLGNIKLEPDEKMLGEIEVSTEKSTFVMSVDKKVYNVDKDISVRGGTALDVMKNVPTISVDADGNAKLRESAVQIYVDGKPTQLTLSQIPADQVDRVEVISNASVKYAANTTGGILNLVLKKNTKPGYNGMLMGNIGTSDRYGFMGNFSVKEKPFNVSLMYSINSSINNNNGYTRRKDLFADTVLSQYNQDNVTRMANMHSFGKLTVDYAINNRNTISISENVMLGNFWSSDVQNFELLNNRDEMLYNGFRINNSNSGFYNLTTGMIYKKTYPIVGKELVIDLNQNTSKSGSWYQFNTYNKDQDENTLPPEMQHNVGKGRSNQYVFQLDYVNPKSEKSKLELGLRSFYKNSLSSNYTTNYNYGLYDYEKDSIMSNEYVIDDMVNAAYINYSNSTFWNIGYMAGLRFEQTYFKGRLEDKKRSFEYIYPASLNTIQNSLFPAIFLSKKFGTKNEVQFNISRKLERPNFFQAMPFVMFSDKKNYRIGNPALKPEFINIAEVNYNRTMEKGSWLISAYGRFSEQPITNTAYPSEGDSSVLVNTFVNGDNSLRYGMENTLRYTFFKKLTATLNVDAFYVSLNSGIIANQPATITEGWSYKAKATLSYALPWSLTAQVNGTYEAPKVIINGFTNPMYFMDASLNKMVGTKWVFNLSLNDVFNTKVMGTRLETDFYYQDLSRRRETRYLKFAVTYLFGKLDASIFKKRSTKGPSQSMSSDGLDF